MYQLSRFVLVGALNTLLGYVVIFGCMYLGGLSPELSNVVGYAVGLTTSYILNRSFTFSSTGRVRGEIARFFAAFLVAYGANFVLLLALVHWADMHAAASQILAGIAYVGTFYLLSRHFVFASRSLAR